MRKLILNLAISLDGFIADVDGGFNWIRGNENNDNNTEDFFDFFDFIEDIDTIIMGSNAYKDTGIDHIENYETKEIIVVTSKDDLKDDRINIFNGDICKKVIELKNEKGKNIWLYGGGLLADSLIKQNLIDEYIIGVIPVILGDGIPLFYDNNLTIRLNLDECTVKDGITIFRYSRE